ncbi:hypothetical protein IW140_001565 [Coemansia sp. RSA 1813]|nr:hypothetical protein EV178_001674 [Coemansia sp. RSA 1646]KAJ1773404.1 hypothetical protein LPJ74_000657 [Coemansia sp. RSA 1843]KAJ2216534.1 hypothetical protein EV179_001329 [Coemansia sp. RSA 487]KAJ2571385.1 hypothetical protein IW140_001565 [Coemansia sp. RSA 1813]
MWLLLVEVKREKVSSKDGVLRGQLIWNFIDMARDQPRRFMLGLSVSGQGDLHAYLCTPSKLYYTQVGSIPVPSTNMTFNPDQMQAVKFLTLLYRQLPADHGFLVRLPFGARAPFKLSDIPGRDLDGSSTSLSDATITLSSNDASG